MDDFLSGQRSVDVFHKLRHEKLVQFLIKSIDLPGFFELGDGALNNARIGGGKKRIDRNAGYMDGALQRDRGEDQVGII